MQNGGNENCFILNMKKYQRSSTNCFRIDGGWLCISIAEKPNHACYKEPAGELGGWRFSGGLSALLRLTAVLASGEALLDFCYGFGPRGQHPQRGKRVFKKSEVLS